MVVEADIMTLWMVVAAVVDGYNMTMMMMAVATRCHVIYRLGLRDVARATGTTGGMQNTM